MHVQREWRGSGGRWGCGGVAYANAHGSVLCHWAHINICLAQHRSSHLPITPGPPLTPRVFIHTRPAAADTRPLPRGAATASAGVQPQRSPTGTARQINALSMDLARGPHPSRAPQLDSSPQPHSATARFLSPVRG
eukprot:scaffold35551_cov157-Isochrysis_galbana.AAC.1